MPRFNEGPRVYNDNPELMDRAAELAGVAPFFEMVRRRAEIEGVIDKVADILPETTLRVPPRFSMAISNPVPEDRIVALGEYVPAGEGFPAVVINRQDREIAYGEKFFADRLEIVEGEIVAISHDGRHCRVVDPEIDWVEHIGD